MMKPHRNQVVLMLVALPVVMIAIGRQQAVAQAPATFRHPGILVNQAQLDFVKSQVNAGVDPWKTAFNAASSSTYASLTYTPHPWQTVECGPSSNPNLGCSDERNDALAAYTQALLWYISGNQTYAQNSVAIMNAWSSTLTGGHINSNAPLQAGWTGSVWPEAAEIIRASYSGWSASDISNFQNMLTTQYVPNLINGAPCKNGNWELIITEALMNISVFNEDSSLFNKAVGFWRGRVPAYMYLPSDGPTPVPPPNCGTSVTTYWNQTTFVDGLAQETARDFGHTFWGLAASVNTAETAFQQGVDLYSENTQRIVDAFEFHNFINNGGSAPSGVNVGPTGGNGATMEICYNHFHNRLGISMPQTAQQIAAHRPTGLLPRLGDINPCTSRVGGAEVRFYFVGNACFAGRDRRWKHELHSNSKRRRRFYRNGEPERERFAFGGHGELQSLNHQRLTLLDYEHCDVGLDSGRHVHPHGYGNQRQPDAFRHSDLDCKRISNAGLHDLDGTEFTDDHRRWEHQLYGQRESAQRLRRNSELEREWPAGRGNRLVQPHLH